MRKIFVNEHVEMFEYDAAEPFLKEKNDLHFYNIEEQGIHKVTKDRWKTAQEFEKRFWIEKNPSAKDDRNYDHFEKFENFNSIKNELGNINSIIELGCGPFTNLRLFDGIINSPIIALVDPLLHDYLNLEHCSYKNGTLCGTKVCLYNNTIEDFNPSNYSYEIPAKFDVVMMINVIEHCFDAGAIFDKIIQILNKDGILIFSDVYFNNITDIASNLYDAGHPLRLSEKRMNQFLQNFQPILDKRYQQLYGQEWRNDIYFIGKL
jgi:SAM-dependent methyltransferase